MSTDDMFGPAVVATSGADDPLFVNHAIINPPVDRNLG